MKTEFPRDYLAAAACCAAAKDIRYYLNGVLVESLPSETRIAATTGQIAGVARYSRANADRFELIIPLATVMLALKMPRTFLSLAKHGDQWSLAGIAFTPIEGKFPDYRRVIPDKTSGESAPGFSPELLNVFAKVGKALKIKSHPIVRTNGKDAALVHFYAFDDFIGVLMPYNPFTVKFPDLGTPSWGGQRA